MTKQQRETGADVPQGVKTDPQSENVEETEQQWDRRSARSRTRWCVPRASDVLEMREREGSDVLGAREDRGK